MKNAIILLLIILSVGAKAQLCTDDDRFTEVNYFQDSQIDTLLDLEYAQAYDFQDSLIVLLLDIYMPKLSEDSLAKRPFVLQMFGGGFVAGNKTLMRGDCMELTRKGFVCASINYRLGDVQGGRAIYRAQQDAHAAMRWIVANADTYGIDTSWMFVGGQSAGAIAAAYLQYANQEDWNTVDPTIMDALGSLDASGNDLTTTFNIKSIIMNWGAVRMDDVAPSEMIPMIAFHGDEDPIVPIDSTPLGSGGSRWLHNQLVANEVCSDLTVAPGAGHSPPVLFPPVFRMSKASCFFKSLFCEDCNSVYVEENVPAGCSSISTSTTSMHSTREIHIFPNPFQDEIQILGLSGNEYFVLRNLAGQCISAGNSIPLLNLGLLNKGMYMLYIQGESEQQVVKLIKQ
jgi:acetyl esterase/lipase